ncbi:MAG TPA: LacI family DNA-binding transcriptional regulator [Acidobacteriaceae bacterium]|nr:LacI family DNA-binding transcriptional regulator [Acidobacteriaceae bacterium]
MKNIKNNGDGFTRIDIRSVAARAKVSIATASRAINHVPSVDPVLASRVWKAVNDLNYLPNTQARALVSGKSRLLGLIVSEITNPFFPELIQKFEQIAVGHHYEILIGSTSNDPDQMERCARRMLERKVDGVAVMTFGNEEFFLERFDAEQVPTIFIDSLPSRPSTAALDVDYRMGIYEGVQHLAVLGHRDIGFISGPLLMRSSQARKKAFLQCLRSTGLVAHPSWVVEGDHTLDGGRDAMERLLGLKKTPTAVMCSNDMTAIGVQHALFEARLKVPDDLSLIGFDDIHLAEYTIPPLTTVRMSCKELAQKAVEILLANVIPAADRRVENRIGTHLVVRQTTGHPRRNSSNTARARGRVNISS